MTVLDPFVGSGTTLVEARLLERNCIGIDHNPLARLVSKVKSTPLDKEILIKGRDRLVKDIQTHGSDEKVELPYFKNRDFWFDRPASEAIAIVKGLAEQFDSDLRDFFLVVLSEVVQKVSKVAPGQLMPAARKKIHLHQKVERTDVFKLFTDQLDHDLVSILTFSKRAGRGFFSLIAGDDARKIALSHRVGLVVTSPPYINAHHYIWTHKLRLLQLGLLNDRERLNLMRKEVGTEDFGVSSYSFQQRTGHKEIDEKIAEIFSGKYYKASGNQNKIRAASVYKYFVDMREHFSEAYQVLSSGCHYCIVIGNNTICRVTVPTADYLAEIAEEVGFREVQQFQIVLRNRTLNLPRNVKWADSIPFDRMIVLERP